MGLRCCHTSIFIETPSLEGLPTKAKEDPSPHEMRLSPAGHQPSISWSWGIYYYYYYFVLIFSSEWCKFYVMRKKNEKKKKNEIPKYVQAQSSILSISNGWPACLMTTWMVKEGWLGYMWSEIFSQIRLIIFRGCTFLWVVPLNGLSHLPGQPGPYNQLLIELLLLVPECCFLQNIEVRVLKC